MKTMIWKELRENVKWALLAFLVLLLAEIYVLSIDQRGIDASIPLCGGAFLMVTAFGCSVIGAALGAIQILPELKRDQWAALLHRPVSRGLIFFGKAIAGLVLCLAATLLPLLASIWYVATPGHFPAPFVPGMILPGLSDILLGIVFYFTALLVCLDRGKWFGPRGMLALAAVPVFVLHVSGAYSFAVLPLAASLLLMLAAWGTLLGNGTLRNMPRWGKISYSLVVLAGAETLFFLLALCLQFLGSIGSSGETINFSEYLMSHDGLLLFEGSLTGGTDDDLTDMEGKPFTQNPGESLNPLYDLAIASKQDAIQRRIFQQRMPRESGNYATWVQASLEGPEFWYILPRQNYLAGYDRLSHRQIGSFDRNGFEPPGATPVSFPDPLSVNSGWGDPVLAVSGSRVYSFSFAERTLKTFLDAGNGAVYGATWFVHGPGPSNWTAVALEDGFRIFDETGRQLMAVPYQRDPLRWGEIAFGASKSLNRLYVEYYSFTQTPQKLPLIADEYDLQGHFLHTYTRPAQDTPSTPSRWDDPFIAYSAPIAIVAAVKAYSRFDPLPAAWGVWSDMPPALTSANLTMLAVIALALAGVTFLWARNTGASIASALGWAAVSFLFGPGGLLTFRLATDWPVQVPCPACRRKRPIDGDRCPHCAQAWTLPERDGTEILDAPGRASLPSA